MKVLILGGAGMLGPYVIPLLASHYELRVTDIQRPDIEFDGEFRMVDVADARQVMDAAEGMDAIVNLSVLRHDRKLAFDVNTLGCYNMMEAAVQHGIRRIINTGPHFTIAGPTYEEYDYELTPDIPPQPGTGLYAFTKSLGHQISRVYAETYDMYVQMYLFYNFRTPGSTELKPWQAREIRPFGVSWQNSAEVFPLGLAIPFEQLPSRFETFYVFTDMPHGRFSNDKVKRVLGWQPRDDISDSWRRG